MFSTSADGEAKGPHFILAWKKVVDAAQVYYKEVNGEVPSEWREKPASGKIVKYLEVQSYAHGWGISRWSCHSVM